MDNKQALNFIYQVARKANVEAETHEQVAKAAQQILEIIEPKEKKQDNKK